MFEHVLDKMFYIIDLFYNWLFPHIERCEVILEMSYQLDFTYNFEIHITVSKDTHIHNLNNLRESIFKQV